MNINCKFIEEHHAHEFTASALAPDIVALNFRSWNPLDENDLDDAFALLIAEPQHRNNGTLAGRSANELANVLRAGGWIFEGYRGVSIKPDSPRRNVDGKVIKYESPRGAGNQQLFVPRLSVRAGLAIASKLGAVIEQEYRQRIELLAPDMADLGFWDWYLEHDGFIIITEGAKKACSLVSAGYPAIALNGIWGWGTNEKDMFGEVERGDFGESLKILNSELEPFLTDREVVLAFDRDDNPLTAKKVEAAKQRFFQEIEDRVDGVTDLKWKVHKGIDDLIAAKGVKALDKAYAKRSEMAPPVAKNVHFTSSIEDGLLKVTNMSKEYIGNHLTAIACIDNPDGDGAALLLEFQAFKGDIRRWTMLRAFLAGDASSIIEGLLSRGYSFKREQRGSLLDYLYGLGADIAQTYTVTDSSGWVGKSFVLPHKTYGNENLKFRDVDPSPEAITELKGTLQGWKDNVAARCASNSRLVLAIGSSFAAPLLPIADVESGGFHLVGSTSQGKTTILSVAASVTGLKTVSSWRTTDNALEGGLAASNHLCLPLDELNQADPRKVGAIVYMLGNGIGKGRSTKDGTNRKPKVWLTLVLSSGETTIGKFMELAGESIKGGQEVRLPNIPAVPDGSLYGCFEKIHGADTAVQFVSALEAAVKQHHGIALDAFLSRLVVDAADPTFVSNISKQVTLIAAKLSEGAIDRAIGRVAKRFALVQVSLGLAHKYDLLPFGVEQIEEAIVKCFKSWLKARGGDGSIEVKQAIARIEHLLVTNEFSDRVFDLRDGDTKTVRNLLAYRKVGAGGETEELWVPPTVFDKEFVVGVNKAELVKELSKRGWLYLSEEGKTRQRQVNGKTDRYFVFRKWKNVGDGGDGSDGSTSKPFAP
jgi:putative DNA primase/helicase